MLRNEENHLIDPLEAGNQAILAPSSLAESTAAAGQWLRELQVSVRDGLVAGAVMFGAWVLALLLLGRGHEAELNNLGRSLGASLKLLSEAPIYLVVGGGLALVLAISVCMYRIGTFVHQRPGRGDLRFFEKLSSTLPTMIYQCRQYPTGKVVVTYTNSAIRQIYELSPEEALQDSSCILDLVHPEDRDRLWNALVQSWKHLTPWREEYRVILPTSGLQWRFAQAHVERLPDGGTLWYGFITDISWRKAIENEVRSGRERLGLATKAAGIGVWDLSLREPLFIWDEQMCHLHGVPPWKHPASIEEALAWVHPDDRKRVTAAFDRSIAKQTPFSEEFRIVRTDGVIRHIKSDGLVLSDAAGHAIRVVGTYLDVSRTKETEFQLALAKERAESADQMKSDFLATMSHEIRTPMNGILGFSELLRGTELSEDQRSYVDTVEYCAENLLVLINDILDLSKITAGFMSFNRETFDLPRCIRETHRLLVTRAKEKSIDYELEIESNVPAFLFTDRTRLIQILTNLLGNAITYTDEGKVRLIVSARPLDRENPNSEIEVAFRIEDSGIGISEADVGRIFHPYTQVTDGRKSTHGGTGLGLAISKQLCELLGGRLEVAANPPRGSVFTAFVLAASRAPGDTAHSENGPVQLKTVNLSLHVLIVDSNAVTQTLTELMLSEVGCTWEVVESGILAVSACQERHYDAVLLNDELPELSGRSTAQWIRRLEKRNLISRRNGGTLPLFLLAATPPLAGEMEADEITDWVVLPLTLSDIVRILGASREVIAPRALT